MTKKRNKYTQRFRDSAVKLITEQSVGRIGIGQSLRSQVVEMGIFKANGRAG